MKKSSGPTWNNVVTALSEADWAFSNRARTPEFHPYPARFIPDIPRQVISITRPNGRVLDPFCGSGTTLVEARRSGRSAVGGDINPIAALISRVRCSIVSDQELDQIATFADEIAASASSSIDVGEEFQSIPRLEHWFQQPAQLAMSGAVSAFKSLDMNPTVRDIIAVSISAATVRISNQESDTRYAAILSNRSQHESAQLIRAAILRTSKLVQMSSREMDAKQSVEVHIAGAQSITYCEDESVSLACFSPPYPNAYEYWLYHKYRMYWLGFDPIPVRSAEIGARPHYSRSNGLTEIDFERQMTDVYRELYRSLVPGAIAIAVVGDSFIAGRHIDNGQLLADSAASSGFEIGGVIPRPVAENKSSFNRAHSRGRKSEHIVIARKKP
jgi:site-specific DNA-methyltransferase (cytosine-N4-specific)